MLKEIYFRDQSDPKHNNTILEVSNKTEALLSKLRMILYSNRGEVLGEPELGLNLEDYLFETNFNEGAIRSDFYAQVEKYIPEQSEYAIDCSFSVQTDGVSNTAHLYITLNETRVLGIEL